MAFMRKDEQMKKIKQMYLSKYEAPFMKETDFQLRNKRKRLQAAGHSLSSPFQATGAEKAWEASGQSRSIEAASGIPDSGGRTGTAACDLCFGLPDASGKAHDNGAEAAGRA